ncbi:energy transducer TonB [Erythrobacter sp. NE805]|uniref:energy transducer TonB n=1 Tax=Erythrobacter sp. NE805 TaxID=3389875 RepID=UPI00396B425E
MRSTITAAALCALVLAAAPARAEIVELASSSPWNVDFGETKCRLARIFGEGENRHLLFFEQYWPSGRVGMTAAGPSFKRFRSRQPTALAFAAGQQPRRTEPFTGNVEGYGDAVVYSSVRIDGRGGTDAEDKEEDTVGGIPALDKPGAKAVEFVSLKQRGDEIRLKTGPLDAAFEVLDRCALDLVGTWGLDIEAHRTAMSLPRWTNRDAVVRRIVADYPRDALSAGEQGIMRLRVIVSAEGKVEDCAILKATNADRLDSPACRAMALARFEPARDAQGKPMRSYHAESIVYQVGK